MIISSNELIALERRFRANFINSLGGFKSVALIGSRSARGNNNLAVFSSLFHLGADPALCGIIVRPNPEAENTLGNIMHSRHYTINHITEDFVQQAHQTSAKYEHGQSEFDAVGLTPEFEPGVNAPFVKESRIRFACELVQRMDITLNGTFLLIGKIIHILVPDEVVGEDGFIDLEKAGTITTSGLDSYHTTNRIARLAYAKP
ncbi:flavin reductase family protein [Parasegetibacter sp. NRK P23]|uniref:flavin reductase family protein n=1 Tax=Parasegetibacter sp. NRK P23 TaxID=2942999 RepID=UPI0020449529|nr:flavin reductase [Parasegetibacter sp. NRK P23]MCM5528426.1 flavin reductase [Parasegetibacter sp. NRK P23]